MQFRKLYVGIAMMIIIASCNSNKETSESTSSSDTTTKENTQTASQPSGTVKATVNVVITGGSFAGTYSGSCVEGCCSWGIAGDNIFGNQYSVTGKGANEFSSLQLVVNNVKGEGDFKTTKEFMATVGFGDMVAGTYKDITINTIENSVAKKGGSGTVEINYSGNKATVKIKAKAADGSDIDATVECNHVINPNNLAESITN